jgi:hypothetical protein
MVAVGIVASRNGHSRNGRVRNGRYRIGRSRIGTSTKGTNIYIRTYMFITLCEFLFPVLNSTEHTQGRVKVSDCNTYTNIY